MLRVFHRRGTHQGNGRRLGGTVERQTGIGISESTDGRVDDNGAPALLQHDRDLMLQSQISSAYIGVEDTIVERRVLVRHKGPGLLKARIVERDVEPAAVVDNALMEVHEIIGIGDVGLNVCAEPTRLLDQCNSLATFIRAAPRNCDVRAALGEREGGRAADAGTAAGDENCLTLKRTHLPVFAPRPREP